MLRFSPALHRACLLMRHDTQHDTLMERAERDHLYNKFIPLLERERTKLRDPLIQLLHGCREPETLAHSARDDPAATSTALILLELVQLLSPRSAPSYYSQELICPQKDEAQSQLMRYIAFLAAEAGTEEARQRRDAARTQLMADVLVWAEKIYATSKETSEITITPSGWRATPTALTLANVELAKATGMLWAGERDKATLAAVSQRGAIDKILEYALAATAAAESSRSTGASISAAASVAGSEGLRDDAKAKDAALKSHSKGLRFLRGDYYSIASRRQTFERLVARKRCDFNRRILISD